MQKVFRVLHDLNLAMMRHPMASYKANPPLEIKMLALILLQHGGNF